MNTTVISILILGAIVTRVITTNKAKVKPTFKEEMVNFFGNVTVNLAFYITIMIIFG